MITLDEIKDELQDSLSKDNGEVVRALSTRFALNTLIDLEPRYRALEEFMDWAVYASAAGTANKTTVERKIKELRL